MRRAVATALLLAPAIALPAATAPPSGDLGGQFIIVASAETRGQVLPCSCPQRALGGFARRGRILSEVDATLSRRLFVELGDVFPHARDMNDPELWARTMGEAYGLMGYDLVILGEEDLALGPNVVGAFVKSLKEIRPRAHVAVPGDNAQGFEITRSRLDGMNVVSVVLWPPLDASALQGALSAHADADLRIGFLHGSVIHARRLLETLRGLDLIVVGEGAKFDEVRWIEGVPSAGPGTGGRCLAFVRFAHQDNGAWTPENYRLVDVGPEIRDAAELTHLVEQLAIAEPSLAARSEQDD